MHTVEQMALLLRGTEEGPSESLGSSTLAPPAHAVPKHLSLMGTAECISGDI